MMRARYAALALLSAEVLFLVTPGICQLPGPACLSSGPCVAAPEQQLASHACVVGLLTGVRFNAGVQGGAENLRDQL